MAIPPLLEWLVVVLAINAALVDSAPGGLPLEEVLLPQLLRTAGFLLLMGALIRFFVSDPPPPRIASPLVGHG